MNIICMLMMLIAGFFCLNIATSQNSDYDMVDYLVTQWVSYKEEQGEYPIHDDVKTNALYIAGAVGIACIVLSLSGSC